MGGGNSKDRADIYDIPFASLDPVKRDPVIGRFQDYEKGAQFNMDISLAMDNRYVVVVAIILLLCMLCALLFFKRRKK